MNFAKGQEVEAAQGCLFGVPCEWRAAVVVDVFPPAHPDDDTLVMVRNCTAGFPARGRGSYWIIPLDMVRPVCPACGTGMENERLVA
jgi:hypothetical protein